MIWLLLACWHLALADGLALMFGATGRPPAKVPQRSRNRLVVFDAAQRRYIPIYR